MTATSFYVPKNNATTTLNGGINDSTQTVVVADGSVFPSTYPFPVQVDSEIMICTTRTGNTLTCTRAQESTAEAAHLTGATIEIPITAGFITSLNTAVNAIENAKGAVSGYASLNASSKVVEQPASVTDFLEGTPTEDLATKAPTSEWAFDHNAATLAHGVSTGAIASTTDIATHAAAADPHAGYVLESGNYAALEFVIDGGGAAITTGIKGDIEVPFACTISAVTLLADQSGSIVVDVWKDTYANFPPTDADSITSATPPTISTATKAQDTTLTSWTKSITAGNILRFNVDSCTTITRVTVSIKVLKT